MGVCDACYQLIDYPYHIGEEVICESCYNALDNDDDDFYDDEDGDDDDNDADI